MSKTTVNSGQSFLNKVVECTGSIDNAFAMALLNGISITDELIVGQNVIAGVVTNKVVVAFFNEKRPATGITMNQATVLIPELGIGTMTIGTTFIVA